MLSGGLWDAIRILLSPISDFSFFEWLSAVITGAVEI